jgi:hypothetical protein
VSSLTLLKHNESECLLSVPGVLLIAGAIRGSYAQTECLTIERVIGLWLRSEMQHGSPRVTTWFVDFGLLPFVRTAYGSLPLAGCMIGRHPW